MNTRLPAANRRSSTTQLAMLWLCWQAALIACGPLGEAPASSDLERRRTVVGGQHTSAFAATGALVRRSPPGVTQFCSGTLVAPDLVLTAAHCFATRSVANNQCSFSFQTGVAGLEFVLGRDLAGSAVRSAVVGIDPHQAYDACASVTLPDGTQARNINVNDLALLRLQQPITEVQPAVLHLGELHGGQAMTIVGYGQSNDSERSRGYRREGTAQLQGVNGQLLAYPFGGGSAFSGDSGGPLFVELADGWRQVGVVSTGTSTGPGASNRTWNLEVRLGAFVSWLAQRGLAGGERPRQCAEDGACDGSCAEDRDCETMGLFQGSLPAANRALGDGCTGHDQCADFLCAAFAGSPAGSGRCSRICHGGSECPQGWTCEAAQTGGGQAPSWMLCVPRPTSGASSSQKSPAPSAPAPPPEAPAPDKEPSAPAQEEPAAKPSNACSTAGGTCQANSQWRKVKAGQQISCGVGQSFHVGLCPGGNEIQCCK